MSTNNWMETNRAVVFPWHCDHFGHMNVRWYAPIFDDAGFHLWTRLGFTHEAMKESGIVSVVARACTDFIHETRAGDMLKVKSGFTKVGNKSFTYIQHLEHAETGVLCAKQEAVEVFFDLNTRQAVPMPEDIRAKMSNTLVDVT